MLILLSFGLCVYRVPVLSLRGDEAATVFIAGAPLSELVQWLLAPNPHQPLYYLLLHAWMRLAGQGELAVRFISLMSGVLLVPLTYTFARRIGPQQETQAAFWAAMAAAINPMIVWDAQDNRMYALLAVWNLASFYLALNILQGRGGWRVWAGYVIATTLALYTHMLAFFILFAENVLWAVLLWARPKRWTLLRRWIAAQMAVAALFAPWLLRSLLMATGFVTDFLQSVGQAEMAARILVSFALGRSVSMPIGVFLGIGFVAIVLLGLWPQRTAETEQASIRGGLSDVSSLLILLIYLVFPLLCIAVFSKVRFPIFDENYVAISLPPFLVLLGRGLSSITGRGIRRWIATCGLVWIVMASSYSLYNHYLGSSQLKGDQDWRRYVARLLECARPGDVFIQNYPDPGLTYYLRERVPRVLLPTTYPMDVRETEAELRRLSERYARVWVQPVKYFRWDSEGLVESWMDRHAFKVGEERFGNARLALYLPPHVFQSLIEPVDATLDGKIRLLGFTLEKGTGIEGRGICESPQPLGTQALRPGDELLLTLYWQPQAPIIEDYTVFVHLYDGEMRIWAQRDSRPVRGTYPTTQWQPGELIVDQYPLALSRDAPSADCRLGVGMYLPTTGQRTEVYQGGIRDSSSTVWLKRVSVTR